MSAANFMSSANLSAQLPIHAGHAAFAGHFPGFPILPGAALLDAVLHEVARSRDLDLSGWSVTSVKFMAIVRPGDVLMLEHSCSNETTIRFAVTSPQGAVAAGVLAGPAAAPVDANGAR